MGKEILRLTTGSEDPPRFDLVRRVSERLTPPERRRLEHLLGLAPGTFDVASIPEELH
ncbi:MAG: hypothetical protein M3T56_10315 [Chloroflexota bacterium]|nr:hypothetical protein [Chloroflexota bacterium]